ncbi:3-hydroxybutyryl-CoA dehydratase [Alkalihalobacillus alcalophilus ATCC 27647 = CGMCC 1.3604]|uniref:3-hydroxybutyryl-CoA dehydratase n=1 Tax=Alkalihalobacillus alcalophilus ATCC 27647 = CGMCC 1.3604 TaxID=1218173 RepID=A0A094WKA6_ALKAL|nr:enoyl-CoA hydratase-related protein [Alkalihalobacillus alcalophilus]KGA96383.1 enoyl-CoA hydratase [Alkalihalobacillus alcalophilus ATCC 27647 = CGMCC 1.3604]MED1563209.1 enoyl-CoA hydratase-related protein [Alkalihalobacillus alcalophilus]THG90010.1 3-hydroxybutyryl-CoA dehydratase [Alkalihalobacillus alcalophilus ATCC 27647 = CGMCC 1.3604]
MGKVLYEEKNQIAYVTINRPEALNCFDYETLVQLQKIVEGLHINKEVRVVIFTGAGERAFSAGADLKERKTLNQTEVKRNVKAIRDVFSAIAALPQPTIAGINGYALGGGFELALACDFRYAVPAAKIGLTEVSWAIIPGAGGTQRLSRLIGPSKAMELILTAKKIEAKEAYALGILNGVAESSQLIPTCEGLASAITANGPIAVQQAKYAILHGSEVSLQSGLALEEKAYEVIIPTKDRMEALEAFIEKRKPNFKGE